MVAIFAILKLVWPVAVVTIMLVVWAVLDIIKANKTRNLSVKAWLIIVIFGIIVGPIVYFLIGEAPNE